jgi:hypothetical protein
VVARHPVRPIPDAELRVQFDLAGQIRDKVNEANTAVIRIRRIKKDVADRLAQVRRTRPQARSQASASSST